jgi:hypothetical protein
VGKKNEVAPSPGADPIKCSKHKLLNLIIRIFEERVFSALDCL